MPKHDQFEELCTLAMAGEASRAELRELKQHLDACSDCRRECREFVELVLPQLSLASSPEPAAQPDAREPAQIRARFLAHAQGAGIRFSESTFAAQLQPDNATATTFSSVARPGNSWIRLGWLRPAIAACVLVAVAAAGYLLARRDQTNPPEQPRLATAAPQLPSSNQLAPVLTASTPSHDEAVERANELQAELKTSLEQLARDKELLNQADAENVRAAATLADQSSRLATLTADNEGSKNAVSELRAELQKQQERAASAEASFVADEVRIHELTDQLAARNAEVDRDRQLMSVKGQNLMATRNLHIVDVFDSDRQGNVRGAFGRIFIVDDKQLIFYAYDLNEARLQDTKYAYRVWGQKEGPHPVARSLGVFASDDRSQRRWIYTCDDPKLLSQIDSVFVTLAPITGDAPRGDKLMYAYLRGPVNHP